MLLQGAYNQAKIFTEDVDAACQEQITDILDDGDYKHCQIRVMPDCHAGKGCVIGLTMMVDKDKLDYINPELVGVDIGCGVTAYKLDDIPDFDLNDFDAYIRGHVNAEYGFLEHQDNWVVKEVCDNIRAELTPDQMTYAVTQMSTLGRGNHFIELDRDSSGQLWVLIHSGSRSLGNTICNYYTTSWTSLADYLHDMQIVQHYASRNRSGIGSGLVQYIWNHSKCDNHHLEYVANIHNYIEITDDKYIVRKGATTIGQCSFDRNLFIVPLNMRDGALLCRFKEGKALEDWNYSAPHGAGRRLSRTQAKKQLNLNEFVEQMSGIFTTSCTAKTLDEAPQAYKDAKEIEACLDPDVIKIVDRLKPVYSFKN